MSTSPQHMDDSSLDSDSDESTNGVYKPFSKHSRSKYVWHLELTESVHDAAFLGPIIRHRSASCDSLFKCGWVSLVLVWCNISIQCVVLAALTMHTLGKRKHEAQKLWAPDGVCSVVSGDEALHRWAVLQRPADEYFMCSIDSFLLLLDTATLDADNDSVWSLREAKQLEDEYESRYTGSLANLHLVHERLRKLHDSGTRVKGDGIPIAWIKEQKTLIELCLVMDKSLCGNLEARGILKNQIPHMQNENVLPADRIEKCEGMMGACRTLGGEQYKAYATQHEELCGEKTAYFHKRQRIATVEYGFTNRYLNPLNGIDTWCYELFMACVLIIWSLTTLSYLRNLLVWWIVLIWMDEEPQDNVNIEFRKDKIGQDTAQVRNVEVSAISSFSRHRNIWFNLLPRTLMWAGISIVGALYLLRADSYENLILNAVALAFLMEVDVTIYRSLISDLRKREISRCKRLKANAPVILDLLHHETHPSICFLIGTVALALLWTVITYQRTHGKIQRGDAIACFCQAEGSNCAAASILSASYGGYVSLAAAVANGSIGLGSIR